jgi:translation initiation factor 3 subunit A
MILFVELCVDLRKGKLAKDGLYQYKNTAQNTNVGTIEVGKIKGNMTTPQANTP